MSTDTLPLYKYSLGNLSNITTQEDLIKLINLEDGSYAQYLRDNVQHLSTTVIDKVNETSREPLGTFFLLGGSLAYDKDITEEQRKTAQTNSLEILLDIVGRGFDVVTLIEHTYETVAENVKEGIELKDVYAKTHEALKVNEHRIITSNLAMNTTMGIREYYIARDKGEHFKLPLVYDTEELHGLTVDGYKKEFKKKDIRVPLVPFVLDFDGGQVKNVEVLGLECYANFDYDAYQANLPYDTNKYTLGQLKETKEPLKLLRYGLLPPSTNLLDKFFSSEEEVKALEQKLTDSIQHVLVKYKDATDDKIVLSNMYRL